MSKKNFKEHRNSICREKLSSLGLSQSSKVSNTVKHIPLLSPQPRHKGYELDLTGQRAMVASEWRTSLLMCQRKRLASRETPTKVPTKFIGSWQKCAAELGWGACETC